MSAIEWRKIVEDHADSYGLGDITDNIEDKIADRTLELAGIVGYGRGRSLRIRR